MKKKEKLKKQKEQINFLENFSESKKNLIAVIVLLIPLLYFFLPFEINNVEPVGNDYLASKGQTHLWSQWMEEHGEQVLWNPNIFVGEPIYSRITPKIIHIDTVLNYLGKIFYWVFWQMFIGGLGIYFFLRYKKIPWYIALIAATAFILLPDWQSLISEGHNSKLRAIMSLPWFWLSFSYFFDKRNWLGAGLFAFTFAWLSRTHHFQIVFYGILVLFFLYIYPTVLLMVKKEYKEFVSLFTKFVLALVLVFFTAAQPLFTTNEYAKYTTRGGNPVNIGQEAETAKKGGGVSLEYATQWSFSPDELLGFFIPRFRGGLQGEIYDGDKYDQLKGQQVPGYWGDKPFNGNYATMGLILFLFAVFGAIYYRKDTFVLSLTIFILFSILLSFGRHFISLYEILFYYLPYFSKFRAPAMIVNITFIAILLLSAYGLKAIIKEVKEKDYNLIFGVLGAGIVLMVAVLLMRDTYAYTTALEIKNYDANTLQVVKDIRKEFLLADTQRVLIFIVLMFAAVVGFLYKKIKTEYFVALVLLLSAAELFTTSNKAYKQMNLNDPDQLELTEFRNTAITKILRNDKSNSRALVVGGGFTDNHYAYFYPLISGYSAIKLQLIQDIISHNLFSGNSKSGINWNIVNMLGGKYIITQQMLPESGLSILAEDKRRKEIMYLNPNAFHRGWFVKELHKLNTREDVVLFMNTEDFDPAALALTASDKLKEDMTFTGEGNVELINYEPNRLSFKTESNEKQFLVVAETFYPKGWQAFVDGEETDIYQVNHLIRGIMLPPGNHTVKFEFAPSLYYLSMSMVWIGDILILILIVVPLYFQFKKREPEA